MGANFFVLKRQKSICKYVKETLALDNRKKVYSRREYGRI
jgi:hypothetical protein